MAFMAPQRRVETAVKTDEIMARFRPIAPKPVLAPPLMNTVLLPPRPQRSLRKRGGRDLLPAPSDNYKRLRAAPSSLPYPLFPASPWAWSGLEATAAPAPAPARFIPKVIAPRPVRPVRTTICVDASSVTGAGSVRLASRGMTAEQVVDQTERDELPAVVSGPGNRVIRANDAYKELVGQPVCPWLDSLSLTGDASRRINGEVVLDVRRFNSTEPAMAGAGGTFSCNSRISWERDGTLASVAAPCDVMRFDCASGGRLFVWRFGTTGSSIFYCPA